MSSLECLCSMLFLPVTIFITSGFHSTDNDLVHPLHLLSPCNFLQNAPVAEVSIQLLDFRHRILDLAIALLRYYGHVFLQDTNSKSEGLIFRWPYDPVVQIHCPAKTGRGTFEAKVHIQNPWPT